MEPKVASSPKGHVNQNTRVRGALQEFIKNWELFESPASKVTSHRDCNLPLHSEENISFGGWSFRVYVLDMTRGAASGSHALSQGEGKRHGTPSSVLFSTLFWHKFDISTFNNISNGACGRGQEWDFLLGVGLRTRGAAPELSPPRRPRPCLRHYTHKEIS